MKMRLSLLVVVSFISAAVGVGCSDGSDKRTKAINNRITNDLAAAKKSHDDAESRVDEIQMLITDTPVEKMSPTQLQDLDNRVKAAQRLYNQTLKRYESALLDDAREKKVTISNHGEIVKNRKAVIAELRSLRALQLQIKSALNSSAKIAG